MSETDFIATTEHRVCRTCNASKPMTAFKPDPTCANGYRHTCLDCFRSRERTRHVSGKGDPLYMGRIAQNRRTHDLKRKYGISASDYNAMHEAQGGKCLICGSAGGKRRLAVDHCHSTGVVRGLLCNPCNQGLGYFKDDVERMRLAIAYVLAGR
jgi:hypothetical protein